MKTISLSRSAARAFQEVTKLYHEGKLFKSSGAVNYTEALRERMTRAVQAFKADWNKFLKLKTTKNDTISWSIRYNALYLLSRRRGCTIYYAIYDTSNGMCYDAGREFDTHCA
jgi:hypothetical protein